MNVETEKQAIRDNVQKAFEAEQRKDLDALLSLVDESIVAQAPNMPQLEGVDALRSFYEEFWKILVSIEGGPTRIFVSEAGDMAWDYGWGRAVIDGPEGPFEDEHKYLEVWQKINGEWKIVAVSYSGDKPEK